MTSDSLTERVRGVALRTLLAALGLAGLGTAVVLHVEALSTLDDALAAAAREATGTVVIGWHTHAPRSAMKVEPWEEGSGLVDARIARAVLKDEVPRLLTVGGRRVLVAVVEPEHPIVRDQLRMPDEDHEHRLVVASAP
ncbi:MAG TPA: hypothetical protein PKA64_03910, partial [Myxococcota bacterium]|nr:hypothetical protein [Myxococcota bacterium]